MVETKDHKFGDDPIADPCRNRVRLFDAHCGRVAQAEEKSARGPYCGSVESSLAG